MCSGRKKLSRRRKGRESCFDALFGRRVAHCPNRITHDNYFILINILLKLTFCYMEELVIVCPHALELFRLTLEGNIACTNI